MVFFLVGFAFLTSIHQTLMGRLVTGLYLKDRRGFYSIRIDP